MPNIEIRMQTVAFVTLLLLLAIAAPFLTALIPDTQPVVAMASEESPQEIVLTLAEPTPTAQPYHSPTAQPTEADSTYLRAVQVQIKSLLAAQQTAPPAKSNNAHVQVQVATGTGANLNVRAAPSLESPVLGGAVQGEALPALAVSLDTLWLQVRWNGLIGWVYAPLTVPVVGDIGVLPVAQ